MYHQFFTCNMNYTFFIVCFDHVCYHCNEKKKQERFSRGKCIWVLHKIVFHANAQNCHVMIVSICCSYHVVMVNFHQCNSSDTFIYSSPFHQIIISGLIVVSCCRLCIFTCIPLECHNIVSLPSYTHFFNENYEDNLNFIIEKLHLQ